MHIQSQWMTNATSAAERPPLAMREGQIFHGKIQQLFPGQTATIQIGQQEMVAKLEVPMKAGDAHYFQVVKTEPELQLRVMSEPLSTDSKQSLQQLLQQLKLPQTKEMQQLVRHMIQQKIPLTRDQLVQAEHAMKQFPQMKASDVVRAVGQLSQLQLPTTPTAISAFVATMNREPLQRPLQHAITLIMQDASIPESMKQQLTSTMNKMEGPIQQLATEVVRHEAVARALTTASPSPMLKTLTESIVARAMQLPTVDSFRHAATVEGQAQVEAQLARPEARQQLQQIEQLVRQLQRVLISTPTERPQQLAQLQQQLPQLTSFQPATVERLTALLQRAIASPTPVTNEGIQQLVQQLVHTITVEAAKHQQTNPLQRPTAEQLMTTERIPEPVMQRLAQLMAQPEAQMRAEANIMQRVDGQVVKHVLQQTMQQLGLHYEQMIPRASAEQLAKMGEQLKPQLVQLLQSDALAPPTREAVEQLVARMNMPLIQSTSDQSLQQQFIMNVPLDFLGKKIDATLQWSGKMDENGKIDENYARILFYLQLETLNETIVDMQVQNRIVTVTIYNETPRLDVTATPFEEQLRAGLERHRYKLSGLFFKPIEQRHVAQPKKSSAIQPTKTSGVDIRI